MTRHAKSPKRKDLFALCVQGWSYAKSERLSAMVETAQTLAKTEDDYATLQAMRHQLFLHTQNQR